MRAAYSPVLEDYHNIAMEFLNEGHEFEVVLEAEAPQQIQRPQQKTDRENHDDD